MLSDYGYPFMPDDSLNSIISYEEPVITHHTHTHTHQFNGSLYGTTRVSQYQKGKTNLDFTEAY